MARSVPQGDQSSVTVARNRDRGVERAHAAWIGSRVARALARGKILRLALGTPAARQSPTRARRSFSLHTKRVYRCDRWWARHRSSSRLMASGLQGQRFVFHGYLPAEQAEREQRGQALESTSRDRDHTQVFIETPYRNRSLFDSLSVLRAAIRCCASHPISPAPAEHVTTTHRRRVAPKRRTGNSKVPTVFLLYANRSFQRSDGADVPR